jgi:N-acetylglucosaminyl-diphospho-decaprenol L-rhamnosyltransferase
VAGTSLAIVLVHYHTPRLAAAAVAALQRDLLAVPPGGAAAPGRNGLEVEWLLVDNGSDAAGRELLASLPVRVLEPGRNLGFAGGVNLGVASSRADLILLMNPDVMVQPGCVAALMESLQGGAAAAGPRFYWDAGRRLLLPPAEERGRGPELLAALAAARGGRWAAAARRRSRLHCRRHWLAAAPVASYALSGSLLAVTRRAWKRVGDFDEGFQLYFEETDWLLRLRRAGLPARFVPAAEAIHLYSRSAAAEPRARQWFEASARRFRRRHYGAWFAWLLARLGRVSAPAARAPDEAAAVPAEGLDLAGFPHPLWVEVTPNAAGFPAAAERVTAGPPAGGAWRLPSEVAQSLPAGPLWLNLSGEDGRDLAHLQLAAADRAQAPMGQAD